MRRVTLEEDIRKDKPVVKDAADVCAICGSQLERDKESGELFCPLCDIEDLP